MRHFFRTMLILCLFFCLVKSAIAENIYSSSQEMQYAIGEHGIWIREGDNLSYWNEGDTRPLFVGEHTNITHIAAGGDLLFFTEEQTGQAQKIYAVNPDGLYFIQGIPLQSQVDILQIETDGRNLFLLVGDETDEPGHIHGMIYDMDPYVGDLNPLQAEGWTNKDICAFSVFDHQLIVQSQTGIAVLDLEKKTLVSPEVAILDMDYVQIGYEYDGNYYAWGLPRDGGALAEINLMNGEIRDLKTKLPENCMGLRRSKTALYTLDHALKKLYKIPVKALSTNVSQKVLTIVNMTDTQSPMFKEAVKLFQQKHPDIEIATRTVNDPRIIATELMAGTSEIDLFSAQENVMPTSAAQMLKAGAIADLSTNSEILSLTKNYEDIWAALSAEGHLFGIPENVYQYMWHVNTELAESLRWKIPQDSWSWEEFQQLAETVEQWNASNKTEQPLVLLKSKNLPDFLEIYLCNHVNPYLGEADFQNEEFITMLTLWKEWMEKGLIVIGDGFVEKEEHILLQEPFMASYQDLIFDEYVLPPLFPEDRYPIYSVNLEVNEHSPLREEAMDFLACLLSPEVEAIRLTFGTLDGLSKHNENLAEKIPGLNKLSEQDMKANEQRWKYGLTHGCPNYRFWDILNPQAEELLPAFLAGKISAEQFAMSSQQISDMMLGE